MYDVYIHLRFARDHMLLANIYILSLLTIMPSIKYNVARHWYMLKDLETDKTKVRKYFGWKLVLSFFL